MDWHQLNLFMESVISIFAIVNPIGNLPIFISLTEDASLSERQRVLRLASVVALLIVTTMAVAGQYLLSGIFNITLDEFRFGGGLILIVVGIRHILERPTRHAESAVDPQSRAADQIRLAVSPIASPLLVGPGAIVTVMLIANRFGTLWALAACLASFAMVLAILNWSHLLYRIMGKVVALAIGRVMDIFIVAIGVRFLFDSVQKVFFPALGK